MTCCDLSVAIAVGSSRDPVVVDLPVSRKLVYSGSSTSTSGDVAAARRIINSLDLALLQRHHWYLTMPVKLQTPACKTLGQSSPGKWGLRK